MAAQVFAKEKKAQIRGELEDLLKGYSGGPSANDDIIDEELGEIASAPPLDFEEMNQKFEKQAKDITNSMLKFYVDLGVIDTNEYLKQKQVLDNSNIQNIFFQLKTIRMAIEKIAEEINQGNTHPRLFEVFGQLQDKLTMVIKTQANYVLFLEDTYKKINQDLTQKNTQQGQPVTPLLNSGTEYYITAGTKNIMKEITAEEIEDQDLDNRQLTHPGKKVEVMAARGISPTEIEEEVEDLSEDVNSLV
jgi:hypothetical protein